MMYIYIYNVLYACDVYGENVYAHMNLCRIQQCKLSAYICMATISCVREVWSLHWMTSMTLYSVWRSPWFLNPSEVGGNELCGWDGGTQLHVEGRKRGAEGMCEG